MQRMLIALLAVLAAIAPAALAQGQGNKKGSPTISALDAKPNPLVFGSATVLSGRLSGQGSSGVTVRLEADDTRPFGDGYKEVSRGTSDNGGRFQFNVKPPKNTQYRVVAQASPPLTTAPRLVLVRYKVGLRVSTQHPRKGSKVRFYGTVLPPKDGATASIQRRSPTGRWVTVSRATLTDAGSVYSRYSKQITVRSDGTYRVKMPGDADRVNGFSRSLALDAR